MHIVSAAEKVVQVIVVHRHGARRPLTKHPYDPSDETIAPRPEALYDEGKEQLRRLGQYLRTRYIDTNSESRLEGLPGGNLNAQHVLAYSSNFTRTLLSSRAFLSGLLPDVHTRVPILLFNAAGDTDRILRGYATCPTIKDKFLEFVNGTEYEKKKKEDGEFVVQLAKGLKTKDVSAEFDNVFNVFDRYNIIKNYDDRPDGHQITPLPDESMQKLASIANWYEGKKFHYATHDVPVAAGLLQNIVQRMAQLDDVVEGDTVEIPLVIEYSAHYPTLLTLLGTLRQSDDWQPPAKEIPGFGAALLFELRRGDDESHTVYMRWFSGGDDEIEMEKYPLGVEGCDTESEGCALDILKKAVSKTYELDFCTECGIGDNCTAQSDLSQIGEFSTCERRNVALVAGIALFVGFMVGLLAVWVGLWFTSKKDMSRDSFFFEGE